MKLIKIATDLKLTVHEFPEGTYTQQNEFLCKLIGNNCQIYEHVMPNRLYMDLHMRDRVTGIPGQCVSMLVDEEGRFKDNTPNMVGSYLYETDCHGQPIMGNILFVGEEWCDDGVDFCGIEEKIFEVLKSQLNGLICKIKSLGEEFGK